MKSEKLELNASGKINIYLNVTGKREDGYHYIYSRMQNIGISDSVIISRAHKTSKNYCFIKGVALEFCMKDSTIPCDMNNLALKGAEKVIKKIEEKHPGLSRETLRAPILIEITKRIPIASGLAGGSADAAATMLGINELMGSPLDLEEIMDAGILVGSDVPYSIMMNAAVNEDRLQLRGKRSVAGIVTGIGEIVRPVRPIKKNIILVNPGVMVSTKEIYDEVDRRFSSEYKGNMNLNDEIIFYNILEECTLNLYKEARTLKDWMNENLDADQILMSGSGPTIAAYYEDDLTADRDTVIAKNEAMKHKGWKVYRTVSGV